MTDPSDALTLYQQAFEAGAIPLQPAKHDPSLYVAVDHPNGHVRFSYVRIDRRTLTVLVMFAQSDLIDGVPVFNTGYAVGPSFRGRGLAKSTLLAALTELEDGLRRAGVAAIQVDAVIDVENAVSRAVAGAIFESPPTDITDSVSGFPALHFSRTLLLRRP